MVEFQSSWRFHVERGPGWLFVTPYCAAPYEWAQVPTADSTHDVGDQHARTTETLAGVNSPPTKVALSEHLAADNESSNTLIAGGSHVSLADCVWDILEQHFTYRLVLELGEIRELTDELIEQLVELHHRVSAHNGLIRVCGLDPNCTRQLQSQNDLNVLKPYPDRTTAVMGYERSR